MGRSKSRLQLFSFTRPQQGSRQHRAAYRPQVDILEDRTLLSGIVPTYQIFHTQTSYSIQPFAGPSSSPPGLNPTQIRTAYGIGGITFTNNGQTVTADGTGQTIAIVDAYDDPSIASDLATFDSQFGLPTPTFVKVGINAAGQASNSSFPTADSSWAGEIELDVEWAHAIAPGASILLVEANSASNGDLLNAVSFASHYTGQFGGPSTSVVSMSWGGGEFFGQTQYDSYFTTPSKHTGVTFFASSGDYGAPDGWPATSSYVVAVGGTTLTVDSAGNYLGESGWSGSGGGISQVVAIPSYQDGLVIHEGSNIVPPSAFTGRATPDVSYDADPNSGVAVYGSYGFGGWAQVGGTSASSPQWAAMLSIVDQGRVLAGEGTLDGYTQTLPALYQLPSSDFHDITSGYNGATAGPGFDLVTGRGTPVANKLIPDLVGTGTSGGGGSTDTPPTITAAASATTLTPTTANLTVTATDDTGPSTLTYAWTEINGPATVAFSPNGTNAAQTTTATFSRAGTYTFQVTVTDPAGLTATSQVSYTVTPVPTSISVSPASASVPDGYTRQFAATEKDQFGTALATQPTFTWSLKSGLGSVSTTGLYTAPASGTGSAIVQVSSGTLSATAQVTVTSATGPTITTQAHVVSQTATTAALNVAATDPAGATSLIYTWAKTSGPAAGFSANGTNAAQNTTVHFSAVGTYTFQVTVSDPSGLTATSSVTVTVNAVLQSLTVTPASVTLASGATQQFTANGSDQFGHSLTPSSVAWTVSGPGAISTTGLFTAGSGSATVIASSGGLTAQATVTVPGSSTSFSSLDVPAYIESWVMTISYLTINQDITIGSLTATLNISYPYDGDLAIDLVSPLGTDVALSYFEGYGANFQNTTFSDGAGQPIYWGYSPFSGSYQPETPLSALMGQDARGTWMLVVSDYGYNYGQLNSWSLNIQPAQMLVSGNSGGTGYRHGHHNSGFTATQAVIPTPRTTYQPVGTFLAPSSNYGMQGGFGGEAAYGGAYQGFGGFTDSFFIGWQSGGGLGTMGFGWDAWTLQIGF